MVDNSPRMLAGRYQLGDLIGRGGMAEVHIGRDTRLGRTVAIKVLRSDLARDPTFQARFRREAQSAAGLNHPSIVAVYDTGEDITIDPVTGEQVHLPFIVMEYVEGHTVRELVRDGSALPIDEAVEITMGVLSALQYAHQAGIVHRDIKPANVMITTTGQVKVMDFGIARALADSAATMTQTQAVIGTAQYLSPEQARGETVDTRSDLYSTGCLLYELLTGRTPFIGDSAVAVAYQHVREEPAPPSAYAPDVPEVLDRITLKALTKDREHRYQTAAEFRADLEAAMSGGQVLAPAIGLMNADTQLMQPTAETQLMGASTPVPAAFAPGPVTTATEVFGGDPADDDDEGMSTKRKVLIGVGIAVGVILLGLIAWMIFKPQAQEPPPTTAPTTAIVPEVTQGMTPQQAEQALRAVNLVPKQKEEPNADVPAGQVVRFDPESGQTVPVQSEVTIVVSSGPDSVTVGSYKGWPLAEVQADLKAKKLTLGDINRVSSTEDKDTVLSTDPAAGTKVKINTPVDVTVSSGQVEVPNVVGRATNQASQAITEAGLVPDVKEEETDDKNQVGKVISQTPNGGTKAEPNSTVTITVGKEPTKQAVPDVYGMTSDNAEKALGNKGFVPSVQGVLTDLAQCDVGKPAGTVCKMDPAPKTEIAPNSTVSIWIYEPTTPTPNP